MNCKNCNLSLEPAEDEDGNPKTKDRCVEENHKDVIDSPSTSQNEYIFACPECGEETGVKFFTMTLKPGDAESKDDVPQLCRNEGIVGTGWGAYDEPYTFEEYLQHRNEKGDDSGVDRSIKDFTIWMEPDDIVFVYDKKTSQYYLTQIESEWKNIDESDISEEEYQEYSRQDVWQFRKANWTFVPRKYLTGSVLSGTPPPNSTIHKKDLDEEQAEYYLRLIEHQELVEEQKIEERIHIESLQTSLREKGFGGDDRSRQILSHLSPDELETIVVSFIQRDKDAVLMQNITGDDIPDVESLLRKVDDEGDTKTIAVQVKKGSSEGEGNWEKVIDEVDDLYMYSTDSSEIEGIKDLSASDIVSYMCHYTAELPFSALLRLQILYGENI